MLLFVGRADAQVKVRGDRVEPGEVERALRSHAHVVDAVVLAGGDGEDRRPVAFAVLEGGLTVGDLRAHAAAELPDHLVPSELIAVPTIAAVATELPAGALMEVMGVGHTEAHELIRLTRAMVGFRDASLVDVAGPERLRLAAVQADIVDFLADLVAERRRAPGEDLISALLTAQINGRPLSAEEVRR